MYVSKPCVLSMKVRLVLNASHPEAWPPRDTQKVIHIVTILILVYIHTYSLFARRINIDINSCATHRIGIPNRICKSGTLSSMYVQNK